MKEIFDKKYLVNFLMLPVIAIGSFYDKRLAVGDFNMSYVFSVAFIIAILFKINKVNPKLINVRRKLIIIFSLVFLYNFLLWLIWGINEFEDYSLGKLYSVFFIILPISIYVTTFDKEEIIVFLKQLSTVAMFLFMLGLVEVAKSGFGESRLAVFGGGPIVFSRWLGLLFLVILYGIDYKMFYKILILIPLIFLMFFSGSKGPLYFLILTVALLSMKTKKSFLILLGVVLILSLNIDLIFNHFSDNIIFQRILGLGENSDILTGSSSSARIQLLQDSFIGVGKNPFGHGLGNFPVYGDVSQILQLNGYPHNFFMETFFELGVLFFLLWTYVFCKLIYVSLKLLYSVRYRLYKFNNFIVSIWVFYALNAMVSGDYSDSRFLILFTVLFLNYNNLIKT